MLAPLLAAVAVFPPEPPAIVAPRPAMTVDTAIEWQVRRFARPAAAECADGTAPFARVESPPPLFAPRIAGLEPMADGARALRFDIAADGRPVSIRESGAPGAEAALAAALAASRFEARARGGCRIAFTPETLAVAAAPPALLAAALAHARNPAAARAARSALNPAGGCATPPEPRVTVFADPARVPRAPGSFASAALSYDVRPDGRTANIRTLSPSANPALDAEARRAVAASRFARGARAGCIAGFAMAGPPLPAPPPPEFPADACAAFPRPAFDTSGAYRPGRYPPDFRRRAVEGWARIRYDLGPGGRVTRAEVVAAQPAEAFGRATAAGILAARAPHSVPGGARDCAVTVRYAMQGAADDPED